MLLQLHVDPGEVYRKRKVSHPLDTPERAQAWSARGRDSGKTDTCRLIRPSLPEDDTCAAV